MFKKNLNKKNLDAIRTMYGLAQVVNHVLADGAHMDRAAMMVETNLTYTDSLFYCNKQGYGATLAIPNSDDELSYLKSITSGLSKNSFVSISNWSRFFFVDKY